MSKNILALSTLNHGQLDYLDPTVSSGPCSVLQEGPIVCVVVCTKTRKLLGFFFITLRKIGESSWFFQQIETSLRLFQILKKIFSYFIFCYVFVVILSLSFSFSFCSISMKLKSVLWVIYHSNSTNKVIRSYFSRIKCWTELNKLDSLRHNTLKISPFFLLNKKFWEFYYVLII